MQAIWFTRLKAPVFKIWLHETQGWNDTQSMLFCLLVLGRISFGKDSLCTLGLTPLCQPHSILNRFLEYIEQHVLKPDGTQIQKLNDMEKPQANLSATSAAWIMEVSETCDWPNADNCISNDETGRTATVAENWQHMRKTQWNWPGLIVGSRASILRNSNLTTITSWQDRWIVPFDLKSDDKLPEGLDDEIADIVKSSLAAYSQLRGNLIYIHTNQTKTDCPRFDTYFNHAQPPMVCIRSEFLEHFKMSQDSLIMKTNKVTE
jgi:hypothetical protein